MHHGLWQLSPLPAAVSCGLSEERDLGISGSLCERKLKRVKRVLSLLICLTYLLKGQKLNPSSTPSPARRETGWSVKPRVHLVLKTLSHLT